MKNILLLFIGLFVFAFTADAQLKVNSDGNVGIQTTNPEVPLDIQVHSATNNLFQSGSFGIQSTSNTNGFLTHNNFYSGVLGNMEVRNTGAGFMMQFVNGRMILRPVPTATAGAQSPVVDAVTVRNSGRVSIGLANNVEPSEVLHVNGNVLANNVSVPSDLRLKKNVNDFEGGLKEVLMLNPITFSYNGKGGLKNAGETHIGLVAQEVQKVAPYLVADYKYIEYEDNSLSNKSNVDEAIKVEEDYLKMRDSEIKFLLINAIKEQQSTIENQNDEIEKLKDQLQELNNMINEVSDNYRKIIDGISVTEIDLNYHELASIEQNVPNPFNGTTTIKYIIPNNSANAQIQIFNLSGSKIKTVTLDHKGEGELIVNALDIPSGIYSYSLIVDGKLIETKKMNLSK